MRGIIIDTNERNAVMLCADGSFAEIENKNYVIGQQATIKSNTFVKYCTVAACFLLLFISAISGYNLYYTPISYVYVEINPSLRLDINRFDKVISVKPLNGDAENLVSSYKVKNSNVAQCVENIISRCVDSGYLNDENNHISIDVMTEHENVSKQINQISEKYKEGKYIAEVSNLSSEENAKKLKQKSIDGIYQGIDILKPENENVAEPNTAEDKKGEQNNSPEKDGVKSDKGNKASSESNKKNKNVEKEENSQNNKSGNNAKKDEMPEKSRKDNGQNEIKKAKK